MALTSHTRRSIPQLPTGAIIHDNDNVSGIDGSDFPRKKKHPSVAYRSHEFFDPAVAPGDRTSRVSIYIYRGVFRGGGDKNYS